jgi:hypothetical protein
MTQSSPSEGRYLAQECERRGIKLTVCDHVLQVSGPPHEITTLLREALQAHETEIIALLETTQLGNLPALPDATEGNGEQKAGLPKRDGLPQSLYKYREEKQFSLLESASFPVLPVLPDKHTGHASSETVLIPRQTGEAREVLVHEYGVRYEYTLYEKRGERGETSQIASPSELMLSPPPQGSAGISPLASGSEAGIPRRAARAQTPAERKADLELQPKIPLHQQYRVRPGFALHSAHDHVWIKRQRGNSKQLSFARPFDFKDLPADATHWWCQGIKGWQAVIR